MLEALALRLRTLLALTYALTAPACMCGGCGVYDPSLIPTRSEQAQSLAGHGSSTSHSDDAADSCETGQTTCDLSNAEAVCVSERCLIVSCDAPYADCDEQAANGCETDLSSPEHCGLCRKTCRFNHAQGECDDGSCRLGECNDGYADCDDDTSNGCEQAIDNPSHCGACGAQCDKPAHASAGCNDDGCGIGQCDSGYGDCNQDAEDGCEQRLTDPMHCGSCDTRCDQLPHIEQSQCENAACVVLRCSEGFADCNGDPSDGCEADLAGASSCGGCGAACDLPRVAESLCAVQQGRATCQVDHACGETGDVQPDSCNDTARLGCASGYADCDDKPENGCETDLSRLSSCGACGRSCVQPHAATACQDGKCVTLRCDPGYDTCGDDSACRSLLDDAHNCGACGNACAADMKCVGGRCTANNCDATHADCDGDSSNGCETPLDSTSDCGGCGRACEPADHAEMACEAGSCAVASCDSGFDDCDDDPRNGCEIDLNSLDDCGGCGSVCAVAHGQARCEAGVCERASCDEGRADCNGDPLDGCEANLQLPDSCGGCDNVCRALPNVAGSTCEPSGCEIQCLTGRGDCDRSSANGCETDLNTVTSCGDCDNDCTALPNVSMARCSEGACTGLVCSQGFADCNGLAQDGCEQALNTETDCGGCDMPCAVAHAQADCGSGECRTGTCDEGFGDCDGDSRNGCEATLSEPSNCGACGNACAAGTQCLGGSCSCTEDAQCPSGRSCCDGRCVDTTGTCFVFPCIPGTQLPSDNNLNCGSCGALCLGWCCGDLL